MTDKRKTINPNEGRPAEVGANGPQPDALDAQRSLEDIWNAILDVKQELKKINAQLTKSDAARENARLRMKLVNEGKVK